MSRPGEEVTAVRVNQVGGLSFTNPAGYSTVSANVALARSARGSAS